jgi:hypothetical protein
VIQLFGGSGDIAVIVDVVKVQSVSLMQQNHPQTMHALNGIRNGQISRHMLLRCGFYRILLRFPSSIKQIISVLLNCDYIISLYL